MKIAIPPHVKLLILRATDEDLLVVGDWMLSNNLLNGEFLFPFDPRNTERYARAMGLPKGYHDHFVEVMASTYYQQTRMWLLEDLMKHSINNWSLRVQSVFQ